MCCIVSVLGIVSVLYIGKWCYYSGLFNAVDTRTPAIDINSCYCIRHWSKSLSSAVAIAVTAVPHTAVLLYSVKVNQPAHQPMRVILTTSSVTKIG